MGLQVYIRTEKLKEAGIRMVYSEEVHNYPCRCGKCESGTCEVCGFPAEQFKERSVDVEGIPFLMDVLNDDVIYHDANHWGSCRKPILAFIEEHKLRAGEDWYEA
jgi:hypothetical protein